MNDLAAQKIIRSQKGFTLIELLVVIVIIGILAGVAISVIDPMKQQNRARDASVKATMEKAILATEGYVSAYGSAPAPNQFINALRNVKAEDCSSLSASEVECSFQIEGNPLPSNCGADGWSGDGNDQCNYHYIRNDPALGGSDTTQFFVYAKSYGLVGKVFRYDNQKGVILSCDESDPTEIANCAE